MGSIENSKIEEDSYGSKPHRQPGPPLMRPLPWEIGSTPKWLAEAWGSSRSWEC